MLHSNTIVIANPSHSTEDEREFWRCFASATRTRGWQFFQLATRNIPDVKGAHTIRLPARLQRTPPIAGSEDTDQLRQQVRWADPTALDLMIEWEHLRWQDPDHDDAMRQGQLRLVHFVDRAVALLRPAVVLTTNKIDHNVALFRQAALAYGATAGFVERSPFDDYWYEPDGIFGETLIPKQYPAAGGRDQPPAVLEAGRVVVERMRGNPYGFRKGEGGSQGADAEFLDSLPRPLWFLPMDNVLWTGLAQREHPQRRVDYPFYEHYTDALAHIAATVNRIGGTLVVKHHPSCVMVTPDTLPAGAVSHDGDLQLLIDKADVVITLLTKLAFVALAMGKPVVTLAHNPVSASGSTYHCTRQEQLESTLRAALAQDQLQQRIAAFVPFSGWLAAKYFIAMNQSPNLPQRTPADLADELIHAAGPTIPHTPGELASIESLLRSYTGIPTAHTDPRLRRLRSAVDVVGNWRGWPLVHHGIEVLARGLVGEAGTNATLHRLFGAERSQRLRRRFDESHANKR